MKHNKLIWFIIWLFMFLGSNIIFYSVTSHPKIGFNIPYVICVILLDIFFCSLYLGVSIKIDKIEKGKKLMEEKI